MKDPIQQLYDQLTEEQLDKIRTHYKPSTRFRASESANCMRSIWHRLRGDRPKPRTAMGSMYGIIGDIDHDVTRQLLNQSGSEVGHVDYSDGSGEGKEQLQIQKPYTVKRESDGREIEIIVSGRADGSIETPRGRALLEIKGTGFWPYKWLNAALNEGFKDTKGNQWKPSIEALVARVKDKHPTWYAQMQTSMAIFGYDLCYLIVKDRSSGTIGQYDEESGERMGIYIEFDPEFFKHTLQRFAHVKSKLGVEPKDGPKPEFASKSKECSYCDFRWMCHEAYERRQKGLEPVYLYPGPQLAEYHDGNTGEAESSSSERKDAKR
jgi:CRISPR/Cas system-associated exonuclease Cas4 (RecB family)